MAGRSALDLISKEMEYDEETRNFLKVFRYEFRKNGNVHLKLNLPKYEYGRIRSMFELLVEDVQDNFDSWRERYVLRSNVRKVVRHILYYQALDLIEIRTKKSVEELYEMIMRNQQAKPIVKNGQTTYKHEESGRMMRVGLWLPYRYALELEYISHDILEKTEVDITVEQMLQVQFNYHARVWKENDVADVAEVIINQILKRGA